MEPKKLKKARRKHEAAVEDANRQITVLMALVLTHSAESLPSISTDSEDSFLSLTSAEKKILADSVVLTENSD